MIDEIKIEGKLSNGLVSTKLRRRFKFQDSNAVTWGAKRSECFLLEFRGIEERALSLIMCQDKEGKYSQTVKTKPSLPSLHLRRHLVLLRMGSAVTHLRAAVTWRFSPVSLKTCPLQFGDPKWRSHLMPYPACNFTLSLIISCINWPSG